MMRGPNKEEAANVARGRLALLYTRSGQAEAAAKVFPFELCRHLRPVQEHLTLQDVKGAYLLNDRMQLVYSVKVVLDLEAIARAVNLPAEVHPVDYFDRKAAYDDHGFECGVHSMWILGIHYES